MANTVKKVYANPTDWNANQNKLSGLGYNWINTAQPGFDTNTLKLTSNDLVLGGEGATGGIGAGINLNGAQRLWGMDASDTQSAVNNYANQKIAENQYMPQYNAKVQSLKNALAQKLAMYDTQKTGINSTYDTRVDQSKLNTLNNQNQFSNNMLQTGFGRSTVRNTGLAGIKNTGNRLVDLIEGERAGQLNNIDMLKTTINNSTQDELAQLEADKMTNIMNLARTLSQRDEDLLRQDAKSAAEEKLARDKMAQDLLISNSRNANDLEIANINAAAAKARSANVPDPSIGSNYNQALSEIGTVISSSKISSADKLAELRNYYSQIASMEGTEAAKIKQILIDNINKLAVQVQGIINQGNIQKQRRSDGSSSNPVNKTSINIPANPLDYLNILPNLSGH
jgi:hypothetical protein